MSFLSKGSSALNEKPDFYEILDVQSDASPREIREAYLRLKAAYGKDSLALYTLMTPEETNDVLEKIEVAYKTLSNPENRRRYDNSHGVKRLDDIESPFSSASHSVHRRKEALQGNLTPGDDQQLEGEDALLDPPATDTPWDAPAPGVIDSNRSPNRTLKKDIGKEIKTTVTDKKGFQDAKTPAKKARIEEKKATKKTETPSHLEPQTEISSAPSGQDLQKQIEEQLEWKGDFIKKIRESQNVTIEEMADYTKISKTYLRAIEAEEYKKLPAAVYLRGFIIQVAKRLKLPHEKVAAAYISRYRKQHKPED